ncbi:MAG: flagellar basal body-associated FliL family protein [Pseudomonadota bacterium]
MKAFLIPIVMLVVGAGAGAGAGLFLAPTKEPPKDDGTTVDSAKETPEGTSDPDAVEFARLNNQFIVPLVEGDAVTAMVVLSLTLEVDPGGTEAVFESEPRLRDRVLRTLFDHANAGGFDAGFTQNGTMNLLRSALVETARATLGPIVHDVLIVDIVRQEV